MVRWGLVGLGKVWYGKANFNQKLSKYKAEMRRQAKMDTKTLTQSDNVTLQLVRESPSKRLVILTSGAMSLDRENRMRFGCMVEIDGTTKLYRPNKTTMKALQDKYGFESGSWVGKMLTLSIGQVQGKEAIIGTPA